MSLHTSDAGHVRPRSYQSKKLPAGEPAKTVPETLPESTGLQSLAELAAVRPHTADESPMITALYEAHLSMEEMRLAFAELRGDDLI